MSKVLGMSHVAFKCADLNKTVEYYRDVLGGEEAFELLYSEFYIFKKQEAEAAGVEFDPSFEKNFGVYGDKVWIRYVKFGPVFVELFDAGAADKYFEYDDSHFNYQHLSLEVDDIHEFTEMIRSKGAPIDSEPALGLEHTWQMWSHDPDGNKIEFMQYTDRSYQVVGKPEIEYK